MKKYDNYKDSGIEWIGEIPKHWEVNNFQILAKDEKYSFTGGPFGSDLKFNDYTEVGVRIIQLQNIGDGLFNNGYKIFTSNEKADQLISCNIFPNEIIIAKMADPVARACFIPDFDTRFLMASDGIRLAVNEKRFNSKFVLYGINSNYFRTQAEMNSSGSTRLRIGLNTLKKLKFVLPSLLEQTAIANYLDHKTTQIDTLIFKKYQFITLLQEERTAVINQAVTKGLDPMVKMKNSGIEWLGEIPKHWEIKKLKYIKSNKKNAFVDGPFGSNLKTEHFVENGDVYVIDSGLITSGVFRVKREMKTITKDHFETVQRSECKQNDIIIAKIGANFGTSGILPKLNKPSLVSGNTLKLTVNEEMYDLKLIHLQLLNLKTSGEIDLLVKGSAQPALSMGVMSDLPFVIPNTLEEQVRIRNYILNQHQRIDELVSKSQQEIELLKEYKTALISEVVTGKVDVREEVLN